MRGDLISLPLQFNWACCFGPDDGNGYVLNIQPVIPVGLNDDWILIVRTIFPLEALERTSLANPSRTSHGQSLDEQQSICLST